MLPFHKMMAKNNILGQVDAAFEEVAKKNHKKLKAFFKISNNFEWIKQNLQEAYNNDDDEHKMRIIARLKEATVKIKNFNTTYDENEEENLEENESPQVMQPPQVSTTGRRQRKAFQEAQIKNSMLMSENLNSKMRNDNSIAVIVKKEVVDMPPPTCRPKRGRQKKLVEKSTSLEIIPQSPTPVIEVTEDSPSKVDQESSKGSIRRNDPRKCNTGKEYNEDEANKSLHEPASDDSVEVDKIMKQASSLKTIVKMEKLSDDFMMKQMPHEDINEAIIVKTPARASKRAKRGKTKKSLNKENVHETPNFNITTTVAPKKHIFKKEINVTMVIEPKCVETEKLGDEFIEDQLLTGDTDDNIKTTDQGPKRTKRGKSKKDQDNADVHKSRKNLNITTTVVARNSPQKMSNATMVVEPVPLANSTVNVAKNMNIDDFMTDDESIETLERPEKLNTNSAVKKKVQEFEKRIKEGTPSHASLKKNLQKPQGNRKQQNAKESQIPPVKSREEEVRKKKEALMQAQLEELNRQRIEKEEKAKLRREARERDVQKVKEERTKKRQEVLKRHEEKKKREEMNRLAEEARREEEMRMEMEKDRELLDEKLKDKEEENSKQNVLQQQPIYMAMKTPALPTVDNIDSDDENYVKPIVPEWMNRRYLFPELKFQIQNDCSGLLFIDCRSQTPDLQEIFPNIHPKKLIRRSSAVWKQPARCVMMDSILEDDDDN